MAIVDGKIRCSTCKELKDASIQNFAGHMVARGSGECRPCKNIRTGKWKKEHREKCNLQKRKHREKYLERERKKQRNNYQKNKKRVKSYVLKQTYGITIEEYEARYDEQGGKCGCCGNTQERKRLFVDHCHSTGKIRGLLCGRCNTAIGLLGDNTEGVTRAIEYLKKTDGGK